MPRIMVIQPVKLPALLRALCVKGFGIRLEQKPAFERLTSMRSLSFYLVLGCFLPFLASTATAAFHLWSVTEVYSSEDGSVQFIKLTNSAFLENQLSNHVITCSGPLGTHTFTFPANLPSTATLNKNFLIGTSNLSTIPGGVMPDYILTNAVPFLFLSGPSQISVGIDGSFQPPAIYTNLPIDGISSLSGLSNHLAVATNAPRNFSSQSNSIVPVEFSLGKVIDTNFVMTFRTATGINGTPGVNYNIEFKDLFTDPSWTPLMSIVGDGASKSVSNALSNASQRLFRIRTE